MQEEIINLYEKISDQLSEEEFQAQIDEILMENDLYDEVDELLDSITTEYPELFEKIDELVSKIAELESFESEYLYKQGYKDCFRLLKLLDT